MHRRKKRLLLVVAMIGIVVVAHPFVTMTLLSCPFVSDYISNKLKMETEPFLSLMLEYMSLIVPLFLGVVVYFQSEKINNLEATQYDVFIGIDGVENQFELNKYLVCDFQNEEFSISHYFTSSQKCIMSHINIGEGAGKPFVIPLTFVTKNFPLITSMDFQSVKINFKGGNRTIYQKTFKHNGGRINAILCDDSHFIWAFGMIIPDTWDVDALDIQFVGEIENQNCRKQIHTISASIYLTPNNEEFILASSSSISK